MSLLLISRTVLLVRGLNRWCQTFVCFFEFCPMFCLISFLILSQFFLSWFISDCTLAPLNDLTNIEGSYYPLWTSLQFISASSAKLVSGGYYVLLCVSSRLSTVSVQPIEHRKNVQGWYLSAGEREISHNHDKVNSCNIKANIPTATISKGTLTIKTAMIPRATTKTTITTNNQRKQPNEWLTAPTRGATNKSNIRLDGQQMQRQEQRQGRKTRTGLEGKNFLRLDSSIFDIYPPWRL